MTNFDKIPDKFNFNDFLKTRISSNSQPIKVPVVSPDELPDFVLKETHDPKQNILLQPVGEVLKSYIKSQTPENNDSSMVDLLSTEEIVELYPGLRNKILDMVGEDKINIVNELSGDNQQVEAKKLRNNERKQDPINIRLNGKSMIIPSYSYSQAHKEEQNKIRLSNSLAVPVQQNITNEELTGAIYELLVRNDSENKLFITNPLEEDIEFLEKSISFNDVLETVSKNFLNSSSPENRTRVGEIVGVMEDQGLIRIIDDVSYQPSVLLNTENPNLAEDIENLLKPTVYKAKTATLEDTLDGREFEVDVISMTYEDIRLDLSDKYKEEDIVFALNKLAKNGRIYRNMDQDLLWIAPERDAKLEQKILNEFKSKNELGFNEFKSNFIRTNEEFKDQDTENRYRLNISLNQLENAKQIKIDYTQGTLKKVNVEES
ncbi:MAG: hypothetical protein HRT47_01300 [Candidatus Caenarcaniphilales bacterium]|nr:hypothetical protein [Candidatus Caenarcaniphilales bacterium]